MKLHVAAKRYLCRIDADYRAQLSPASEQSLVLQGGPFSDDEARAFKACRHFREAVRLRLWDDRAKVPDWQVPGLDHYRATLESALREGARERGPEGRRKSEEMRN